MIELHPEVLAAPQRRFWEELAPNLPKDWVLYRGTAVRCATAIASPVDFEFFSDMALDESRLHKALPRTRPRDDDRARATNAGRIGGNRAKSDQALVLCEFENRPGG